MIFMPAPGPDAREWAACASGPDLVAFRLREREPRGVLERLLCPLRRLEAEVGGRLDAEVVELGDGADRQRRLGGFIAAAPLGDLVAQLTHAPAVRLGVVEPGALPFRLERRDLAVVAEAEMFPT